MAKLAGEGLARLRERAERLVQTAPPPPSAGHDELRLLHELEVHQVELSMQYEELERAQLELERSHAEFVALYDTAPVGCLTCTPEGHVLRANPFLAELLGTTVSELVGTPFPRFAAPGHHDRFHLHAMALRGESVSSCEMELLSSDGVRRFVRLDGRAEQGPKGAPDSLQICVIDLTEQREAEARALEMTERRKRESDHFIISKLESVGLLAGGIAHDFNNLLTGILGNVALARLEPAQADELLEEAERAARRATMLANQLLTFAKGGKPVKTNTSLAGLLEDTAKFALRGSNVQLELAIAPDLWSVDGDATQLSQALHNVVINARESMPTGGTVVVGASNVTLEEDEIPSLPAGSYVRIRVEDNGVGIDESDRPRVFDPYFTTKDDRSGLGLATVFAVVRDHGGLVTAISPPAGGTAMVIHLPAAAAKPLAQQPDIPSASHSRQRVRVLVMDDEPSIRRLIERVLSRSGFQVDGVADGRAAVDAYRDAHTSDQPYDLVVLDLTVPGGMGGLEALGLLRALDPAVRAIVSSGYSVDPVMSKPAEHGFAGVVKKPFSPADLSTVVDEVLDRHAPPTAPRK